MDPISQGAVGAAFAQAAADREKFKAYAVFGALAGMAPDLDVLIQSSTDPLLFLEFHRHFTHALVFIPIGALIVTGALFKLWKHPLRFKQAYIASLIGYATHGLLDACTSYGTQLFWPFTNVRIAWNNVSVVDPIFTIPLLILVIFAIKRRSRQIAFTGILWILGYLALGVLQHNRAVDTATALAQQRGHTPERLTVKPGFGNLIIWKSIYEHDDTYFVDGIRTASQVSFCPGKQIAKYDQAKHAPNLVRNSQQAADIERFRWFSQDYLAYDEQTQEITDIRYSTIPNETTPMWSVRLQPDAKLDDHIEYVTTRRVNDQQASRFWSLLAGDGCQALETIEDPHV